MSKSFRMRQDTEDWFSNIKDQKPIQTKFDLYYFCLMIGFASGRRSEPAKKCPNVTDFVENFVKDYRPSQTLIVGLLLKTELSRRGIKINEKDQIRSVLLELVDPSTPTNLTDKGMDKMNEYASGGYEYLAENLNSKPYHVEEFLITYTDILREAVNNNPNWQSEDIVFVET